MSNISQVKYKTCQCTTSDLVEKTLYDLQPTELNIAEASSKTMKIRFYTE